MTSPARILVLDDEPIVGERLKASLERAGFIVDAFVSSRDALDNLKQKNYDILVTDLKMKKPDGLEVLRAARQQQPDIDQRRAAARYVAKIERSRRADKGEHVAADERDEIEEGGEKQKIDSDAIQ